MTDNHPAETIGPPERYRIGHGACGQSWTGANACHCSGCCLTFSSLTVFDGHQRSAPDGSGVICLDPAVIKLVPVAKPWGTLWSSPSTGTGKAAYIKAAGLARSAATAAT